MKVNQTRKVRGYKARDCDYDKAKRRGEREKFPLATMIEKIVHEYGRGAKILINDADGTRQLSASPTEVKR